jgi:hypothetical protein
MKKASRISNFDEKCMKFHQSDCFFHQVNYRQSDGRNNGLKAKRSYFAIEGVPA